jgi:hypothetical protein
MSEIRGLQRQRRFLDGNELGEGADAIVVRACIDFIAGLEVANASADTHDRSGHVVAQDQGEAVGKNQFEFAALGLRVQGIDARRVDPDQDVIVPDLGVGHVGNAANFFLSVPIDDESFHGGFFQSF